MKLTTKNAGTLLVLSFLGAVVGGLAWELVERILATLGTTMTLSVGPIGFDLHVISFHFLVNPGTFLGLGAGVLLFRVL